MATHKIVLCLLVLGFMHCVGAEDSQAATAQQARTQVERTGLFRRMLLPWRKDRLFYIHDRNHQPNTAANATPVQKNRPYTSQNAYDKPPHDRTYRNFQYLLNLFQGKSPAELKDRSWTGNLGSSNNRSDATGLADYEEDDDDPTDWTNATKTTRREQGRDEDFRNDPQHAGMDETEREDGRTHQKLPTHDYRPGRGL